MHRCEGCGCNCNICYEYNTFAKHDPNQTYQKKTSRNAQIIPKSRRSHRRRELNDLTYEDDLSRTFMQHLQTSPTANNGEKCYTKNETQRNPNHAVRYIPRRNFEGQVDYSQRPARNYEYRPEAWDKDFQQPIMDEYDEIQDPEYTHHRQQRRYKADASPPLRRPKYYQESFLERERRYRETPAEIVNRPNPDYDPSIYEKQQRKLAQMKRSRRYARRYQATTERRDNFQLSSPPRMQVFPRPTSYREECPASESGSEDDFQWQKNMQRDAEVSQEQPVYLNPPLLPRSYLEHERRQRETAYEARREYEAREIEETMEYSNGSSDGDLVPENYSSPPPAPQTRSFSVKNSRYRSRSRQTSPILKKKLEQRIALHEIPTPGEADAEDRFLEAERTTSSRSMLKMMKPVQRMRLKWEAKMKEVIDLSSEKKPYSSEPPKKFSVKNRQDEQVFNPEVQKNEAEEKYFSSASRRSSKGRKSGGEPPRRSSGEHSSPVVESNRNEVVALEKKDGIRDSYIESKDIKRFLGENEDEAPTKDVEQEEGPKIIHRRKIESVKSYAQKWKSYRRVTRLSSNNTKDKPTSTGLTYLEFNEPRFKVQKQIDKIEGRIKEVKSDPPNPPIPPPPLWWNYFSWGKNEVLTTTLPVSEANAENSQEPEPDINSFPTSISGSSMVSFAMAIGCEETNNRIQATDPHLKSLNADFDQIATSRGEAITLELKESKLELNKPFEKMKSVSQANLFNRGGSDLALNRIQESISEIEIHAICQGCKNLIKDSEKASSFTTAGLHWHSECFLCSTCGVQLNDNNHFWQENKLYCVIHYAQKVKAPVCAGCHQYIFESTYTRAKGKTWHKNHFKCWSCDRPIIDTKYVTRNAEVICFECHEKYFSHKCETCGKRIRPTEQFVYLRSAGKCWHATDACLQCGTCHQSLVDKSKNRLIFVKNGVPYCNTFCAQMSPLVNK